MARAHRDDAVRIGTTGRCWTTNAVVVIKKQAAAAATTKGRTLGILINEQTMNKQ